MIPRILLSVWFLFTAGAATAQIPNPSFENWTEGQPDGWYANNVPGIATPITPVQPGAVGSFALQGEVVSYLGFFGYTPLVQAIFPLTERPAALTGSYLFTPVGGDSMFVGVTLYGSSQVFYVGFGSALPPATGSAFETFTVPFEYIDQTTTPDSCIIQFIIVGEDSVHVGSRMVIDNLAFTSSVTALAEERGLPTAFILEQNYPNPFNPSTAIRYTLPAAGQATLTVSNLLGETVATIVDAEQPAGTYEVRFDAANLPSGLYFYTLRSGAFLETRRMMLLK